MSSPSPNLFLYLKLGLVSIVVIGIFMLAGLGKIDASMAIGSVVATIGALVVALGISGSGASQAAATRAAAALGAATPDSPPPPSPAAVPTIASLQAQLDALKAKPGQAGFGAMPVLVGLTVLGLIIACFQLAPMHLPALLAVLGIFFAIVLTRSRVLVRRRVRSAFGITSVVGVMGIAGGGVGANCNPPPISPNAQAEIVADEQLAACIEGVYFADTQKVPPPAATQILIDEGMACGPDIGPVITNTFGKATATRPARPDLVAAMQTDEGRTALAKGASMGRAAREGR